MAAAPTCELDTPHGTARVHLHEVEGARAALMIGHGAGGGVGAPDIVAATEVANELGVNVVLLEQPYRVAGKRAPARAPQLDAVWVSVVEQLRDGGPLADLPLIAAGRSMGARVACRTAEAVGAAAVLCLAFPLVPPRRAGKPEPPSRLPELELAGVPTLVVQGERDSFGMPPPGQARTVTVVPGDHSLKKDLPAVRSAVSEWLTGLLTTV